METLNDNPALSFSRPTWPFALVACGGVVFALGSFFLALVAGRYASSAGFARVGLDIFMLGAAAMGVGWLWVAKQGYATVGASAGCAALLAGFALLHLDIDNLDDLRVVALGFTYAIAMFAWSLVSVRGLSMVRVLAVLAAIPATMSAVGATIHAFDAPIGDDLLLVTLAVFVILGVVLGLGVTHLHSRTDSDPVPSRDLA